MIANRNLYLARDGITVVEESDTRQQSLLVGSGCFLPDDLAAHYGILAEAAPVAESGPDPAATISAAPAIVPSVPGPTDRRRKPRA